MAELAGGFALAGFNVGLEIRQCAFVVALAAAWWVATGALARFGVVVSARSATVFAAGAGGLGASLSSWRAWVR